MPIAHYKVRLMGTMVGGEVWSCTIGFRGNIFSGDPIQGNYEALKGWADRMVARPAGALIPSVLTGMLSTAASITKVRVERYDGDGKLAEGAEAAFAPAIIGVGVIEKPTQTALVLTLMTGRPGRSYTGRIYWPCLAAAQDSATARLKTPTTQAVATAAAEMISNITDDAPELEFMVPAVVSVTKSEATPITSVRVGNVLDTQRRRRDAYVEAYATAPLV